MPYGFNFPVLTGTDRYLVFGPHCWGKDRGLEKAIANMKKEGSFRRPRDVKFIVYRVHEDTTVDSMGYLRWPTPAPAPVELCRFRIPYPPEVKDDYAEDTPQT